MVRLAFLIALFSLSACSSDPQPQLMQPERDFTSASEENFGEKQFYIDDPIEGTNKQLYKFNAEADEYVLLPVVDAYKFVTPEFLRNRVSDFFLNVGEFGNFTNAVLQIQLNKAGITLARFGVNSTIGLLGTFDVATDWGLERQPEDFGKTLGHYGVGPGPYFVIPLLGPSNLRDATGTAVDYAALAFAIPSNVSDSAAYDVVAYGLEPIDMRYSNKFRYFESGSPFEYELVRYIVTTSRQLQIDKERHANTATDSTPQPAENAPVKAAPIVIMQQNVETSPPQNTPIATAPIQTTPQNTAPDNLLP